MKYAACAVVLLSCAFARASSIPATARSVQVSGVSVSPARFARPSYGPEAGPASAVRPVPLWPGLKVQGQVLANGLQNEVLVLTVWLRRLDGSPVAAARGGPPGYADERGRFRSIVRDPIRFDFARWAELSAAVPAAALALPPGRSHALILTYHVAAGPCSASAERQIAITMPEAEAPPAALPPPLLRMLACGDADGALGLLDGVPPNAVDAAGRSVLHLAAAYGLYDLVGLLTARGAELDATDGRGRTPLHLAALRDHANVVRLLVEKGAVPGLRDARGDRPADLATGDVAALLVSAEERWARGPGAEALVRAEAFLRGTQAGDREELARCAGAGLLASLPAATAAFAFEFELAGVEPVRDGARVTALIRLPGETPVGRELRATLGLTRAGATWNVTEVKLEPRGS